MTGVPVFVLLLKSPDHEGEGERLIGVFTSRKLLIAAVERWEIPEGQYHYMEVVLNDLGLPWPSKFPPEGA